MKNKNIQKIRNSWKTKSKSFMKNNSTCIVYVEVKTIWLHNHHWLILSPLKIYIL